MARIAQPALKAGATRPLPLGMKPYATTALATALSLGFMITGIATAVLAHRPGDAPPQGPDLPGLVAGGAAVTYGREWPDAGTLGRMAPGCAAAGCAPGGFRRLLPWEEVPLPAAGPEPSLPVVPGDGGAAPALADEPSASALMPIRLAPVPEPANWLLLLAGFALVGARRRYLATL